MAQKGTADLATEIDKLYLVLVKTNHSPAETAITINSILLSQGITSKELGEAWNKWFAVRNGRIEER